MRSPQSSSSVNNEGNVAVAPVLSLPALPDSLLRVVPTIKGVGLDAEYELIVKVLKEVKFNKVKAAKILNIDRKTLYNKLDEHNVLIAR